MDDVLSVHVGAGSDELDEPVPNFGFGEGSAFAKDVHHALLEGHEREEGGEKMRR